MTQLLDSLELFHGELTPNRAVVHARLPVAVDRGELSLAGFVRGPRCSRGSTLPATYGLAGQASNRAEDESGSVENRSCVTAQALVTEPIFWSPDWPALYDVTVELRRGSEVVAQTIRTMGLKPLAVLDKGFDFGGKFWVLRAVRREDDLEAAVDQCRVHAAALMAPSDRLDNSLLTKASEQGVLVVAELPRTNIAAELSRLGQFAAVALGVVPPGEHVLKHLPRNNVVLAQHVSPDDRHPLASGVRLVLAEVFNDRDFVAWAKALPRPVIAYRPLDRPMDVAAARAECDRLQRDLAPYGQFAGYIV